jgi:hypothetical protein
MKSSISLLFCLFFLIGPPVRAQYGPYPQRPGYYRVRKAPPPARSYFKPGWDLSLGYGVPNLDMYYLPDFGNTYKGSSSQTGPWLGSLDYHFNPRMSLGVLVTRGLVSTPYYYYYSGNKSMTGKLDNWSIMLDMIHHFPAGGWMDPYFRTALGVNIWKQEFQDPSGNQVFLGPDPSPFAYQVSLGLRARVSPHAGFFLEAGYGKYILNGGLSFRL